MYIDFKLDDLTVLDDVTIKIISEQNSFPYDKTTYKIENLEIVNIKFDYELEIIIETKSGLMLNDIPLQINSGDNGVITLSGGVDKQSILFKDGDLVNTDIFKLNFSDINTSIVMGELKTFNIGGSKIHTGSELYILSGGERNKIPYHKKVSVDIINNDFTISIECISGFMFKNIPLESSHFDPAIGDYVVYTFEGTEFIQTYSGSDLSIGTIDNIEFENAPVEDTENLPYNKVYDVKVDSLNALANYSYVDRIVRTPFNIKYDMLDYAKYISSLVAFPYQVEISQYEDRGILLGDINTNIPAKQITEYLHDINLGSIIINDNETENIGFSNINIELFVPYFNKINLEVDEVLGFEISLKLRLNIITGKGTLNVFSLRSNSIIHSESKQIGFMIPYYLGDTIDINKSEVIETAFSTPYIQLKVLKPNNDVQIVGSRLLNIDNEFRYMKDDDDINIKTYATDREQKLIKEQIRSGIFVRK